MTVCAVPDPCRRVSVAKARKTYASLATGNIDLRQLTFEIQPPNCFVTNPPDPMGLADGTIYAVVYYFPANRNPLAIGCVRVGFPDSGFKRYLEDLDLTRLFHVVAPAPVEQVEDFANVEVLLGQDDPEVMPGPLARGVELWH